MVPGKPSGAGGVEPRDSLGAPLRAPYLALLKCASYDPSGRSIPWHSTPTCAIKPHMDGAPIRVRGCLVHPPASMKLEKSWEISIMSPYLAPPVFAPHWPHIFASALPLCPCTTLKNACTLRVSAPVDRSPGWSVPLKHLRYGDTCMRHLKRMSAKTSSEYRVQRKMSN